MSNVSDFPYLVEGILEADDIWDCRTRDPVPRLGEDDLVDVRRFFDDELGMEISARAIVRLTGDRWAAWTASGCSCPSLGEASRVIVAASEAEAVSALDDTDREKLGYAKAPTWRAGLDLAVYGSTEPIAYHWTGSALIETAPPAVNP